MSETALSPLEKLDPVDAWQPWVPDAKQPWNGKWAGHLYRRAAFGANLTELREAQRKGLPATLEHLLQGRPGSEDRDRFLAVTGKQIAKKDQIEELRGWWLYAMLYSLHPLREKMTLFWHNHFATSIAKVQRTDLMFRQNQLLRKHALGGFRSLLLDMSRDPAMLVWLDSNGNIKGRPNENYARELMELFSLGTGHYHERDVREAARAFTGWHTDGDEFEFDASAHDGDEKTFLNRKGNWNGEDIVRIVLEQDAAALFLARKLYRYFISETARPPDTFLKPLADDFRKSDYDIAGLVRRIVGSRHFFSEYAYRQRIKNPVEFTLGAVRAAVPDIEQIAPTTLVSRVEAMGQPLFSPPNVGGWPGGQNWLNTATVLARHNFAQMVASGKWIRSGPQPEFAFVTPPPVPSPPGGVRVPEEPPPPEPLDPAAIVRKEKLIEPDRIVGLLVELLLQGSITAAARSKLVAFVAEGKPKERALDARVRATVHALMAMPEYQLA